MSEMHQYLQGTQHPGQSFKHTGNLLCVFCVADVYQFAQMYLSTVPQADPQQQLLDIGYSRHESHISRMAGRGEVRFERRSTLSLSSANRTLEKAARVFRSSVSETRMASFKWWPWIAG